MAHENYTPLLLPYGAFNSHTQFSLFTRRLREKGGLNFTREMKDEHRTIKAKWLEELVKDSRIDEPIRINYAIIEGPLNLPHVIFTKELYITETVFSGAVNLSFAIFEQDINLKGTRFLQKTDFRAVHAKNDFHVPLAKFDSYACFDDLYVDEVFSAEGAEFNDADFNRISFTKSALFSGALMEDGTSVQTTFGGEASFNDAHFKGPTYFCGALFQSRAVFDRVCFDSSAFFNCDKFDDTIDAAHVRHKRHKLHHVTRDASYREVMTPTFKGKASFIGARVSSSMTFSGALFCATADFRRLRIEGTALFDPYISKEKKIFSPVSFHGKALFWNTEIKGAAKFESAQFYQEADFEHIQIGLRAYFCAIEGADNKLYPVRFHSSVNFSNARVNGSLEFHGAQFGGSANFERINVGGRAFFNAARSTKRFLPVYFKEKVNFLEAYIKSSLQFDRAQFRGEAVFERLQTDGNIYFRAEEPANPNELESSPKRFFSVTFTKRVSFVGANVRGSAEFDGAKFLGDATFEQMDVGMNINFRPWEETKKDLFEVSQRNSPTAGAKTSEWRWVLMTPVTFFQGVNFVGTDFRGDVEFSGTQFRGNAGFTGMKIGGSAYFDSQLHYTDKVGDQFSGQDKKIQPVRFFGRVDFSGAQFHNQVVFKDAMFMGKAQFINTRSTGVAFFKGVTFKDEVTFRESQLSSLIFDRQPQQTQFARHVDLRGCSYERIEVKLRHLLPSIEMGDAPTEGLSASKYNRQTYTQLVKALRAAGDERRADYVYLRQRGLERTYTRKRAWQSLQRGERWAASRSAANLIVDWFFWLAGNYGVQPERLFFISIVILAIGTYVFSLPNATKEREQPIVAEVSDTGQVSKTGQRTWLLKERKQEGEQKPLSALDSARLSFSLFIPIIDIPSGSKWKPSENRFYLQKVSQPKIPFDLYASFHRMSGAILVPLLIAALAAGLYRRLKSEL